MFHRGGKVQCRRGPHQDDGRSLQLRGPGLFRQRGGFLWQIDGFGILPECFDFGRLYGFRSGLLRSLFTGQHFPIRQLLLQFSGEFL